MDNKLFKVFIKYVSANVISMLGLSLYIFVDTFFVAKDLGINGLAALNIAIPLFGFITGMGHMIGMGGASKYSYYVGLNDSKKASSYFTLSLVSALIIGSVISIVGLINLDNLTYLLGGRGELENLSKEYVKMILIFSVAFILNNTLISFVRNDNNPSLAMKGMITSSITNIVLDYIFMFPMGLGMFGAALATGISPIMSIFILSVHWFSKKNNLKLIKTKLNFVEIKDIFATGVPFFINEISSSIVILTFNYQLLKLAGDIGVAAYGVITNLAIIITSILNGIGQGIQPIISKLYGENKFDDIKKIFKYAAAFSLIVGIFVYFISLVMPETLISIFNSEKSIELEAIAVNGLKIYFTAFIIMGFNIITISLFASISKPIESFAVSFLKGIGFVVPYLYLFSETFGLNGVWLVISVTEISILILSFALIFRILKKENKAYVFYYK